MRGSRFGIALRQRGTPAKERQIDAREIEGRNVAHRKFLIIVAERWAGGAAILERVQFREQELARTQLIEHRFADETGRADDRDSGQRAAVHRVITGVVPTTSAHCARKRR